MVRSECHHACRRCARSCWHADRLRQSSYCSDSRSSAVHVWKCSDCCGVSFRLIDNTKSASNGSLELCALQFIAPCVCVDVAKPAAAASGSKSAASAAGSVVAALEQKAGQQNAAPHAQLANFFRRQAPGSATLGSRSGRAFLDLSADDSTANSVQPTSAKKPAQPSSASKPVPNPRLSKDTGTAPMADDQQPPSAVTAAPKVAPIATLHGANRGGFQLTWPLSLLLLLADARNNPVSLSQGNFMNLRLWAKKPAG
jgi:hypothetical protein